MGQCNRDCCTTYFSYWTHLDPCAWCPVGYSTRYRSGRGCVAYVPPQGMYWATWRGNPDSRHFAEDGAAAPYERCNFGRPEGTQAWVDTTGYNDARGWIYMHDRRQHVQAAPLMSGWWTNYWRPRSGWTIAGYHSHRTCTLLNGAIGNGPEPFKCAFVRIPGAVAPAWADNTDWYSTPAASGFQHVSGDVWRRCPTEYNADGRRREGTAPSFKCSDIPGSGHTCSLRSWSGHNWVTTPAADNQQWDVRTVGAMVFHYTNPSWPASNLDMSYRVAPIAAPSISVVIQGSTVSMSLESSSPGTGTFVLVGDWGTTKVRCYVTVRNRDGVGLFDANLEQWEGAGAAARALPSSNNFRFAVPPTTENFFFYFQWQVGTGGSAKTLYNFVKDTRGLAAADTITYHMPFRWLFPKCGTGQYQVGDTCLAVSRQRGTVGVGDACLARGGVHPPRSLVGV